MRYLFAYSLPIVGFVGFYERGIWTFSALVFAFGFIPLLEILLAKRNEIWTEQEKEEREASIWFSFLLYLNVPIVYFCLFYCLFLVQDTSLAGYEFIGIVLSLGVLLGANGINVGHELGHRTLFFERLLAKMLLIPSHYTHFFVEHNLGHHYTVSTPEDPSTAKYNQSIYLFWIQTITGTYVKAWQIQKKLNGIKKTTWYSPKNDMFWFTLIQIIYLASIFYFFGWRGFILAFAAGFVGILLLETINYIEHYGLRRKELAPGKFEKITEQHSWNSNHLVGRVVLYELTRHSDHHYRAHKKYQILENHEESPQLPFGYPTSMMISLIPPLWFAVMNKRVPREMITLAEKS